MLIKLLISLFFVLQVSAVYSEGSLEYDLFDALDRADIEYARELIKKGADVNIKQEPFKQTPVIIAPLRGLEFVKLLVENGADVNMADQDNNSALLNAALYGEVESFKYLIKHGANIYNTNNDGLSVMEAAKTSGQSEIISILQSMMSKPK